MFFALRALLGDGITRGSGCGGPSGGSRSPQPGPGTKDTARRGSDPLPGLCHKPRDPVVHSGIRRDSGSVQLCGRFAER